MLGFIVAPLGHKVDGQFPNEIAYSGKSGPDLCPFDPQWNQHGEQGLYYDTMLGGPAIPTDAELARNYGYTPVQAGWVKAKEGYFPGPWRVPGGWNPAGAWGPPMSLSGAAGVSFFALGVQALAVIGAISVGKYIYRRMKK